MNARLKRLQGEGGGGAGGSFVLDLQQGRSYFNINLVCAEAENEHVGLNGPQQDALERALVASWHAGFR